MLRLMPEFEFIFETPWRVIKGDPYPCTVDRPKDQRKQMYLLNHFIYGTLKIGDKVIDMPQPDDADQTNGPDLTGHADNCRSIFQQIPTFVAVDFYEKGTLLQAVAQVNGVKYDGQGPSKRGVSPNDAGKGSNKNDGHGALSLEWRNKALLGSIVLLGAMTSLM
ncbi:hypothetical protein BGW38_006325 [Lunasporangiospora selenospora]|uniref:Uncharacterized protein n=1 Tax=Lunasporangiospora selenospora TaxID=979761 RepID=A0A9P6KAX2_9FUNG|nr:hypothetical protein BGW38_006325 [Lunasporangiospora selenospora]